MRRLSRPFLLAGSFAIAALTACSDDPEEKLFGDLDPPTPNKLAGVWKNPVEEAGMVTEIRLEFTEDLIIGAVKCTPKSSKLSPVTVGGEIGWETNALEAASGQFTVANFTMVKSENGVHCEGGLRGGTWDFKIEELKLTLTTPDLPVALTYSKIGE
jgi:hypothetical protein